MDNLAQTLQSARRTGFYRARGHLQNLGRLFYGQFEKITQVNYLLVGVVQAPDSRPQMVGLRFVFRQPLNRSGMCRGMHRFGGPQAAQRGQVTPPGTPAVRSQVGGDA